MDKQLYLSSSPHIHAEQTTGAIMRAVIYPFCRPAPFPSIFSGCLRSGSFWFARPVALLRKLCAAESWAESKPGETAAQR